LLIPSVEACGGKSKCQVHAPADAQAQPVWLEDLKKDRNAFQKKWNGGVSDKVPWTLTSYIQPQIHPYDRYLYNAGTKEYTVRRYLEDLRIRYGGIDSVLMWPVYTQIGVDDRNQFDMWRSMPGGLDGVANLTAQFHEHGVKMLWPNKPWDVGTHREPEQEKSGDSLGNAQIFARLLKQTGGDGLNGDTMDSFPEAFYSESANVDHPIALEPEGGGEDVALKWTTMGWGYWDYPAMPVVDRFKFITGGKFLTNVCDRWAQDKTNNLQSAWFNGDGYESWENVWGIWNGITPADGEAIRRVATMLRHFGKEGFLQSPDWEPYSLDLFEDGVYSSKFPLTARKSTVWTVVNRNGDDKTVNMKIKADAKHHYDCYRGIELAVSGSQVSFTIEAHGYGCIYETDEPLSADINTLLRTMQDLTARKLASYDHTWKYLPQQLVEIHPTALASKAPPGTVFVPREENFKFETRGVEIEGDDSHGVDVQFSWDDHPHRSHSHTLSVGPFYMDKFPVTNANYFAYLSATGYRPADDYHWLQNWNGSTMAPDAIADLPVNYVSMNEARAYCAWKGARLPHTWEWQYAAQGTDGRVYPWGNDKDQSRFPVEQCGKIFTGSEPVTAHAPQGDSPFGVSDLVGNVWQYTDEFQDEHTRYVIVRGGSNYRPQGSHWYFPQAKELNLHNKYFLMDDRYERSGAVGFRCVVDAAQQKLFV